MSEVSLDEFKKYFEDANVSSHGKILSTNMQGYIKYGINCEELGDPKRI